MSTNDLYMAPAVVTDSAWLPSSPHDTEVAAAGVAALSSRALKARALLLYAEVGEEGLTDDELTAALDRHYPRADGYPHNPSKLASRRKELEENRYPDGSYGAPLVEPTGEKRLTRRRNPARVYRITATGLAAAAQLLEADDA